MGFNPPHFSFWRALLKAPNINALFTLHVILTLKLLFLLLCLNPQGCLWEHSSCAQHVFVPVRPAAPDSPDSDSEAHYEHHSHGRAQYQNGTHIFHRGNDEMIRIQEVKTLC